MSVMPWTAEELQAEVSYPDWGEKVLETLRNLLQRGGCAPGTRSPLSIRVWSSDLMALLFSCPFTIIPTTTVGSDSDIGLMTSRWPSPKNAHPTKRWLKTSPSTRFQSL